MIAYIAGAISDNPNYEYDFADCEMVLKHMGRTVLSPTHTPFGLSWEDYMKIDKVLLEIADEVFFLDGWKKSKGAKIEHEWAKQSNKKIYYYNREKLIVRNE